MEEWRRLQYEQQQITSNEMFLLNWRIITYKRICIEYYKLNQYQYAPQWFLVDSSDSCDSPFYFIVTLLVLRHFHNRFEWNYINS